MAVPREGLYGPALLGAMMAAPEEASEAEVLSNMASKARPGFTTVDEEHADHLSVLYACAARGAAQELRHVLVTFERRGWDVNVGGKPSSRAARTLRRRTYCRPVLRPSTSLIIASLTGAAECVSALLDFDGIDPNAWCRVSLPLFGIYVGAGGCCALLAACRAGRADAVRRLLADERVDVAGGRPPDSTKSPFYLAVEAASRLSAFHVIDATWRRGDRSDCLSLVRRALETNRAMPLLTQVLAAGGFGAWRRERRVFFPLLRRLLHDGRARVRLVGAEVVLRGLASERMNGRRGTVAAWNRPQARWAVDVAGTVVAVRGEHLEVASPVREDIRTGDLVEMLLRRSPDAVLDIVLGFWLEPP